MKWRDSVVVLVLLAIGTVLQYFLSLLNTLLIPDLITAFFCLAIILFRPKFYEALGIGIIGGGLSMVIPGSRLPSANLISGLAGAYCCFYFYELLRDKSDLAPLITTFSATLTSGLTFVAIVTGSSRRDSRSAFSGVHSNFVPNVTIPLNVCGACASSASPT